MKYEEMSNGEISAYHIKMNEEYEAIKREIQRLAEKLDKMDAEYLKGKRVLDKRLGR